MAQRTANHREGSANRQPRAAHHESHARTSSTRSRAHERDVESSQSRKARSTSGRRPSSGGAMPSGSRQSARKSAPARSSRGEQPTSQGRVARASGQASRQAKPTPKRQTKRRAETQRANQRAAKRKSAQRATASDSRSSLQIQEELELAPQELPEELDPREYESMSVAELRQADRRNERLKNADKAKQARRRMRRYIIIAVVAAVMIVGAVVGAVAIYNSSLFTIRNVTVSGVEHLTASEMTQLANVPDDTTLLRVDAGKIAERVKASAWVDDVEVKRVFPDTLELVVKEREMAAIVEIPVKSAASIKQWAIATDNTWLMPIPDPGSEAAQTTSARIYEDADSVIHFVDVPFGTSAEIGKQCTDSNVNNALAILSGMTTELADQVVKISAAGVAETTLVLANGVEVAFGEAKDIRDKERVVLEILEQNPDNVAYINVRMVETPTWRAI